MTTAIESSTTLADVVTGHPDLASELERRSLDYCCGGQRTLADACVAQGLDPVAVARELTEQASSEASPAPWTHLDGASLVDYLEDTHHAFLHAELPRIAALVTKVRGVHGHTHPELVAIESTFGHLRDELEPHLAKEEQVLFPMIRQLTVGDPAAPGSAALVGAIGQMLREHDHAGALLGRLRALSDGYCVPPDGCASYRALYLALETLEADTHLHVHIENNRLFPMVAELGSHADVHKAGTRP
ncbi:iron-sulfur cluster repair di-iron protein [Aquihabitans sp. G128]|uniref:iron-sulfur cluster repair di-iron protein n=1 Tax=Aquihabitans sp. G128 TaxID=2849779 RepID=UPI001C237184|nr:iron-sulfur cluster repair di-iron protein [Aquihabitans sp. G128]QXC60539.1 iron-sulfur cluster repair di-iron protein [Aquihabitans sp. G128]